MWITNFFFVVFFFFKQKTAYEIGTGDWSSDVCSSDLALAPAHTRSPTPMLLFKLAVNSEVVMDGDVIVREPDLDTAQCGDRKSVV